MQECISTQRSESTLVHCIVIRDIVTVSAVFLRLMTTFYPGFFSSLVKPGDIFPMSVKDKGSKAKSKTKPLILI